MAKRVQNIRELRRAAEAAEKRPATKKGPAADAAAAEAKPRRVRKKKEPPRLCARWGVFDAAMRQVAVFDYNQRAEADRKRAELAAKRGSPFFLQVVKEPMPERAAEG